MSMRTSPSRSHLSKTVSARQFFTLAYGTVVGVGWVIYPGIWLATSGPLGAILGFAGGTLIMLVIALCYTEMASMFPVAGGEVAYTYEVYGLGLSFLTGWLLAFEYIAVTSWEAISLALIADYLFPGISGPELYSVGGHPVRLGSLLIAVGGMVLFTLLSLSRCQSSCQGTGGAHRCLHHTVRRVHPYRNQLGRAG